MSIERKGDLECRPVVFKVNSPKAHCLIYCKDAGIDYILVHFGVLLTTYLVALTLAPGLYTGICRAQKVLVDPSCSSPQGPSCSF